MGIRESHASAIDTGNILADIGIIDQPSVIHPFSGTSLRRSCSFTVALAWVFQCARKWDIERVAAAYHVDSRFSGQ